MLHNTTESAVTLTIDGTQGNVELARGTDGRSTTADGVSFIGNFQQFRVTGVEGYAAIRSNGSGAWLSTAGATVGTFRAYLSGVTAEQMARGLTIGDETIVAGIAEMALTQEETVVYDLLGRRMGDASSFRRTGTAPGMYIIDGKKTVVR